MRIAILFVLYVVLLTLQVNLYPGERFPGWDHFWVDVRTIGKLLSLKDAVHSGELPLIVPYTDFGWNLGGDHHSFWNPLNLLVLALTPQTTVVLLQITFLTVGSIGAYLFLRKVTGHGLVSFMGGFTYVTLPYVLGLFYYEQSSYIFYLIPLYLFLTMRLLERPTIRHVFLLWLLSAFAIGSADIHALLVLPTVGFLFTFLMSYKYYGRPVVRALGSAALVSALSLLAGSFYVVPLYSNLKTMSDGLDLVKAAGVPVPPQTVDFLAFFHQYGFESLYKPFEGSALHLYIPALFYVAIVLALAFHRAIFDTDRRQVVVVLTLVLLGITMFLISFVFYHPLFLRLVPSARETARGVLRYQINLVPFVNVLAGFICLAAASECSRRRVRIAFFLVTIVLSLLIDYLLFGRSVVSGSRLFESSNRVELPVYDALRSLPWLNAWFGILVALQGAGEAAVRRVPWKFPRGALVLVAALLGLVNISLHNQILAQTEARFLARSSYRMENYFKRKSCLDGLIVNDPNYRILYAGRGNISSGHGRDWKLIAETELHVGDRKKVLFSYREFTDPYVGLLRGVFEEKPGFWRSSIWPPLSSQVPANLKMLNLMGVRYVISADAEIKSSELAFLGRCASGNGDYGGLTWSQAGLISFQASLVENNLLDSAFHTDISDVGSYLMADTGAGHERSFVGVILHVGPKAVNATWDVQFSDDGTSWTTVYEAAGGHPFGPGRYRYTWRNAGKHRYWRLLKADPAAVGDYHNEVQFFDEAGPGFAKYHAEDGFLFVYEVVNPMGIAFLADGSTTASPVDSLRLIYERTGAPWIGGVVLLEEPVDLAGNTVSPSEERGPTPALGTAAIVDETDGRISITTKTPKEAFLVLTYTFRLQWRAYLDSSEVKIYRAYGGFMSVRIPPGEHVVVFRYRPIEIRLGLALTLIAFVVSMIAVRTRMLTGNRKIAA